MDAIDSPDVAKPHLLLKEKEATTQEEPWPSQKEVRLAGSGFGFSHQDSAREHGPCRSTVWQRHRQAHLAKQPSDLDSNDGKKWCAAGLEIWKAHGLHGLLGGMPPKKIAGSVSGSEGEGARISIYDRSQCEWGQIIQRNFSYVSNMGEEEIKEISGTFKSFRPFDTYDEPREPTYSRYKDKRYWAVNNLFNYASHSASHIHEWIGAIEAGLDRTKLISDITREQLVEDRVSVDRVIAELGTQPRIDSLICLVSR